MIVELWASLSSTNCIHSDIAKKLILTVKGNKYIKLNSKPKKLKWKQ